jgi:hypothetical protein
MYSQKIIDANLDLFEAKNAWRPVYHTLGEVNEFKEGINKLVKIGSNSKGSWIEGLNYAITDKRMGEIRRWVENEQVICGLDSLYFESRYAFVCDEKGQIYKFQPRLSQQIYNSIIADFDEKQVSIELLILKGRQLGITTQTALKFLHRMLFLPHTQSIMASVKAEASQLIKRILDTAYERCPFWLVPYKTPKGGYSNGSILSIQSGMQATGLAQGWTPSCIHLSELADIPDPTKTIEEGLFRAAHSSKNLFMVLEGTGGGNTGWLADTWRAAKEDWPKGQSRLCPVFIPWPMCPEIYPQPDWIRKFPIENSWRPSEATRRHVSRCESYIRNTPYLSRVAGINYRMPVEQQWYWEFNYNQACKNHTQRTWASQMPADDFESLTGKHDPIFEQDVIDEVENNIYEIVGDRRQRKNVVQEFAIIGHDVDESFYPDPSIIDTSKQVVTVKWKSHRDQRYEWEMIPLLPMDEQVERNTMDRVLIYEEPQKGQYYSCGIDTADGLGKEDEDRTVLSVANNRFQGEADKQVAEFTSNKVNAAQVVAFAACLGAYYGPYCPDSRGMKYVIEQIGRPGETCQHQLKMMGFNHHHKPKRYDNKKIKSEAGSHEGWWSSSWSVPILMTRFVEAVNGGWYVPSSKWLIEELKTLERHATSGKSKMEHRSGQHDDRVRAAAQSYFTAHDMDILTERAKRRYDVPVKKNNDPNKGRCMSNTFSVGDW